MAVWSQVLAKEMLVVTADKALASETSPHPQPKGKR